MPVRVLAVLFFVYFIYYLVNVDCARCACNLVCFCPDWRRKAVVPRRRYFAKDGRCPALFTEHRVFFFLAFDRVNDVGSRQ